MDRHQGKHWDHHNCKTEVDIVKASCAAPTPPAVFPRVTTLLCSGAHSLYKLKISAKNSILGDVLREYEAPQVRSGTHWGAGAVCNGGSQAARAERLSRALTRSCERRVLGFSSKRCFTS